MNSAPRGAQLRVVMRSLTASGIGLLLCVTACGTERNGTALTNTTSETGGGGAQTASGAGSSSSGGLELAPIGGEMSNSGTAGASAPTPRCDDTCDAVGVCDNGVCVVSENPAELSEDDRARLKTGGALDPEFRFLYPYDRTVFPRGILPPTLQLTGDAAAFYVHISLPTFEYEGFHRGSSPARIALPASVWTALTRSATGTDAAKVTVSKLKDGAVIGPISQAWTIANGSLRGALYYDNVGSVQRLRPGERAQTFLEQAGCVAVSADGTTLVATMPHGYQTYDLRSDRKLIKDAMTGGNPGCGALYPDGSLLLLFTPLATPLLVEPRTAAELSKPGWPSMTGTATGSFSPDGSRVVFKERDDVLTVMTFDRSHTTFSERRDFEVEFRGGKPTFTPDSASVIYDQGGRLKRLDIATGAITPLDQASGVDPEAGQVNFASTALPIAVGGYYWVVFTSNRPYGNTDSISAQDMLWAAALDMSGTGDSSHPAFFLDGQSVDTLNRFSQWALDPCQSDGSRCDFGDQCCGGYCRDVDGTAQCLSTPPKTCANEFEKCTKRDDCCDESSKCINNHCAVPTPVVK